MLDIKLLSSKLFIHVPKNAGMTIRTSPHLLNKVVWSQELNLPTNYRIKVTEKMKETGDHPGYEHARWRDVHPDLQILDAFAFVRNPWARVASRYNFARKVLYYEESSDQFGDTNYCSCDSFEEFLEERHKWGNQEYMWHRAVRNWYPAFDHVEDGKGNVKCTILRTEHLDEDLSKFMKMPLTNFAPRNVTAISDFKDDEISNYKDLYTKNTIQLIADWYKKDIDYWGFDFDTPATKNYLGE